LEILNIICLDVEAPCRVIRVRDEQIENTKLEALKKRRNRFLKKFKKTKALNTLEEPRPSQIP